MCRFYMSHREWKGVSFSKQCKWKGVGGRGSEGPASHTRTFPDLSARDGLSDKRI